jgi:hypothetical protein
MQIPVVEMISQEDMEDNKNHNESQISKHCGVEHPAQYHRCRFVENGLQCTIHCNVWNSALQVTSSCLKAVLCFQHELLRQHSWCVALDARKMKTILMFRCNSLADSKSLRPSMPHIVFRRISSFSDHVEYDPVPYLSVPHISKLFT